jgi:hypothetical protein
MHLCPMPPPVNVAVPKNAHSIIYSIKILLKIHVSLVFLFMRLSVFFFSLSINYLKVVTNEKIGGSGVTSTLGTWYGGVVMGVLLSFNEAAILYRDFNSAPSQKQNIIVFAANNSRCCECHVAPTIIL